MILSIYTNFRNVHSRTSLAVWLFEGSSYGHWAIHYHDNGVAIVWMLSQQETLD